MQKSKIKDLLDFTFEELEKVVNEKSDKLAEEEKPQGKSPDATNQADRDRDICPDEKVSTDEDIR